MIQNRAYYASRTTPDQKIQVVNADFSGWVVYELLSKQGGTWARDMRTRMRDPKVLRLEYAID